MEMEKRGVQALPPAEVLPLVRSDHGYEMPSRSAPSLIDRRNKA
jgi:hypothetical protein